MSCLLAAVWRIWIASLCLDMVANGGCAEGSAATVVELAALGADAYDGAVVVGAGAAMGVDAGVGVSADAVVASGIAFVSIDGVTDTVTAVLLLPESVAADGVSFSGVVVVARGRTSVTGSVTGGVTAATFA